MTISFKNYPFFKTIEEYENNQIYLISLPTKKIFADHKSSNKVIYYFTFFTKKKIINN